MRRTQSRLLPLGLVFFAAGVSTAMAAPFLSLFLTDAVHATGPQVAVFLVAAPISTVVVSTFVGRLSDRARTRQWLLVAAAASGCVGAGLTAVLRNYLLLLVVAVTLTALAGAFMSQVFAYTRESLRDDEQVAMTISSLRSLFSVAWVAGPPLAAALLHLGGFALVYAGSSLMYAVAAAVVLLGLNEPRPDSGTPDGGRHDGDAGAGPVPEDASRLTVLVTALAFALTRCAGVLAVQALPLFTTRVLPGAVQDAGWLLGLCAALEIPLMLAFGWLSTRYSLRALLFTGLACGLAYLTVVSFATATWQLAAGQVLNAAGIAAASGLGITYIQDLLPRQPGRASTLYSNTYAIGSVLAGPVVGAAQHYGYRMPYVVGAVVSAAAIALLATRPTPAATRRAVAVIEP